MGRDTIVLLGVNHKTTPLAVREKLALTSGYEEPLTGLRRLAGLSEYYLLSTCNRVEVLFTCQDPTRMRREVLDFLFAGNVSREEVVSFSPILADRLAATSSAGMEPIVRNVLAAINKPTG